MLVSFMLALLSTVPERADAVVDDARLNDICFFNVQYGWAVGDRGVIWKTDNGGQRWQLQPSGVTCPLWAVWFQNEQLGWAAGGWAHPYTHSSTGVVLATRDGGQTWTANPQPGLPALRRLRFFDPQRGWAVGCPSAMYPSGVFETDNGGRQWRPLPSAATSGWLAADFLSPGIGALGGRGGSLALVRGGQIETARSESFGLESLSRMQIVTPAHTWLVGDGGSVRISNDLGSSWQVPPGELPRAAQQFDFAALAARGPKCWVAGSPGTRVFHTSDAGRSWNASATGSTGPLRALCFVDDQHGWAVGELGTILATGDSGQTWQRQRSGGDRAALLGLLAEADDVPLELVARLAGNEGYLTVIDVLGRRDVEITPRDDVPLADRLHEAVVDVGGCAANIAWQFPLRQSGLRWSARQIVDPWDRASNGRGIETLQAYLVRQIRLWRPDVILTHDSPMAGRFSDPYSNQYRNQNDAPSDDDALPLLIHQAVLQAVNQAADGNAFSAEMADAGLPPWTVKRVLGVVRSGARGANELTTSQFAPRLGQSLAEAAAEPRGLLQDRFTFSPPTLGFQTLLNAVSQEQDRHDFFGGISLAPGSPARRVLSQPAGEGVELRQRIAQKRRHVQAILDKAGRTTGSVEQLLAQVDELGRDLDDRSRGQILFQLGDRYYRAGHWPLAAETFQVLADRYPQHALATPAMLWLVHYYASNEAAWRVERGDGQKRLERAIAMGKEIERTQPHLFAEPAVCFPLAAAYRGLNQPRQAERLYQTQNYGGERGDWSACARGELYLTDPQKASRNQPDGLTVPRTQDTRASGDRMLHATKPTLVCVKVATKPRLDGLLDDAVWQQAKPAVLQSAQHDDADWPAAIMLAHDNEFFYLAARCRRASGDNAALPDVPAMPRPRDTDLSAHDRIEVLLDIDRDYATYYHLTVDDRGWTNDRCWNDATWDPKWFVAAHREPGGWTVEAAIGLTELVDRAPPPGAIWVIGLQRVVPGVGFQSWSAPAAIAVLPDGFGNLVFR